MDGSRLETHGSKHHSYRLKPAILILIGLVVGGSLYFGVMAWYFTGVDPGGGPSGFEGHATKSSSADAGQSNFALPSSSEKLFSEVQVMWMHYTAIGLGDRPGTGRLVPVELHPRSERIPARGDFPPGPGHAQRPRDRG